MSEPRWLGLDAILAIHQRQLAEHGGAGGIRDEGLLSSALHRPYQVWSWADPPPDLARLAAAYAFGLARNHPFIDGYKRIAFVACRLFLLLNGVDLIAPREEKYLTFVQLAEGGLAEEELAAWLRSRLREVG